MSNFLTISNEDRALIVNVARRNAAEQRAESRGIDSHNVLNESDNSRWMSWTVPPNGLVIAVEGRGGIWRNGFSASSHELRGGRISLMLVDVSGFELCATSSAIAMREWILEIISYVTARIGWDHSR